MSEETHEVAEQLFDTDQTEVADDATDTDSDSESTEESTDENTQSEQEQEGSELSLDETDKAPSKAEETRLKSIKKWQKEIDEGKKTVDDLKPAQDWMKVYLKAKDAEPEVDHKAITKALAKEAIAEERMESQFQDLYGTLKEMKLSKEQMTTLNDKFKDLTGEGLSKLKALNLASEIAKVDFTGLSEKKRRMIIPQPSTNKPSKEVDMDSTPFSELKGKVSQEKIDEHLRKLVGHA